MLTGIAAAAYRPLFAEKMTQGGEPSSTPTGGVYFVGAAGKHAMSPILP